MRRRLARGGLAVLLGGIVACGGYLWLVRPGVERAALAEEGDGSLRTVVVDAEGLFLLYDAAVPEGQAGTPAGYVAYWRDFFDETLYVFDRLLFTPAHVGRAVHALRRDLDVQGEALGVIDPGVGEAMGQAGSAGAPGWGSWTPAGEAMIAATPGYVVITDRPIKLLTVRDPSGQYADDFSFYTDPAMGDVRIVERIAAPHQLAQASHDPRPAESAP